MKLFGDRRFYRVRREPDRIATQQQRELDLHALAYVPQAGSEANPRADVLRLLRDGLGDDRRCIEFDDIASTVDRCTPGRRAIRARNRSMTYRCRMSLKLHPPASARLRRRASVDATLGACRVK